MPQAKPEEQYGPEIEAIVTDIERKHLEKMKAVQDENDALKKEAETVDARIEAAESKGWAGAVAAFKRRVSGGG